jgi:uncharacterized alpha-E superfamily protein
VLPARAGDNLYWLGRYVERAEGAIRLLRAYHLRIAETDDPDGPLLTCLRDHLEAGGVDPAKVIPDRLRDTLASAIASASHVRDRFSLDGWMALNDLARSAGRMSATAVAGDDAARAMSVLLRKITGFSGLVHDNMYRSNGWMFLSIGRSLERALAMSYALATFADRAAPEGALDLAVEIGDSAMTHRRRFTVATNRSTVIDLLALDTVNPRSILHHLGEIRSHVADLPGAEVKRQMSPLARAVLQVHTELAVRTPETLDTKALIAMSDEIAALSNLLSATYFK